MVKSESEKELKKLLSTLNSELIRANAALDRSSKRRKQAKKTSMRRIDLRFDTFRPQESESRRAYKERLDAEALARGITTDELVMPYIEIVVSFWELVDTDIVYVDECMIARFNDEGNLKRIAIDDLTEEDIDAVIVGLKKFRGAK